MVFVHCHGSIKDIKEIFGISYPTIKNRIDRIARQFEFVEIVKISTDEEVIGELERGEISAEETIRKLPKYSAQSAGSGLLFKVVINAYTLLSYKQKARIVS